LLLDGYYVSGGNTIPSAMWKNDSLTTFFFLLYISALLFITFFYLQTFLWLGLMIWEWLRNIYGKIKEKYEKEKERNEIEESEKDENALEGVMV
jgi:1,4-dihydroxy-2-naphthoate octaprenyltransferase